MNLHLLQNLRICPHVFWTFLSLKEDNFIDSNRHLSRRRLDYRLSTIDYQHVDTSEQQRIDALTHLNIIVTKCL